MFVIISLKKKERALYFNCILACVCMSVFVCALYLFFVGPCVGLWAMILKYPYGHIRIHDDCEVCGIEKSIPRITD